MDNTKELLDIYDVWYRPWWRSDTMFIVWIVISLGLFFLLCYFLWNRYIGRVKKLSFDQLALLDLEKMKEGSYPTDPMLQDAYFNITMITKMFLSKKYQVSLLDKTDQEIVDYLKQFLPDDISAVLAEFFDRAFQIKFAKVKSSEKMLYDDIICIEQTIYRIIKHHKTVGDTA